MRSNYATDDSYGSEALLEESGPIRLDTLEGSQPEEEMRGDTECLNCALGAKDCVCKREGA